MILKYRKFFFKCLPDQIFQELFVLDLHALQILLGRKEGPEYPPPLGFLSLKEKIAVAKASHSLLTISTGA